MDSTTITCQCGKTNLGTLRLKAGESFKCDGCTTRVLSGYVEMRWDAISQSAARSTGDSGKPA